MASPPATAVWKAARTRPATQRGDIVCTPMLKMVTLTIQAPPAAISASPVNHGEALNATTNEARPRMTTPPVTDVPAPGPLLSGDTQNAPMTAPLPQHPTIRPTTPAPPPPQPRATRRPPTTN